MMVPHHQGAIDMAVALLRYGRNERLKRLAQEIIVTQQAGDRGDAPRHRRAASTVDAVTDDPLGGTGAGAMAMPDHASTMRQEPIR